MPSVCTLTLVAGVALGVFVVSHVLAYLRSPLKDIPGPFLAKFTNIWRFIDHYKATQISTQRRLHETLGPAVRIGPNVVSLSDPTLLKTVYSTRGEYIKVCFPPSLNRGVLPRGIGGPHLALFKSLTPHHRVTFTQSMTPYRMGRSSRMSLALVATPSTAST